MSYDLDKLARAVCGCGWCLSGLDCRFQASGEGYEEGMKLLVTFRKAVVEEVIEEIEEAICCTEGCYCCASEREIIERLRMPSKKGSP